MSRKHTYLSAVGAFVVVLLAFGAGAYVGFQHRPAIESVTVLSSKETGKPEQVDFSPFWQAWNVLDEKFMPAPAATSTLANAGLATTTKNKLATSKDRVWGAIAGMTKALGDPYTTFFPPVENKSFSEELSGEFGGVGMEVGIKKSVLTVIAPIDGSPAMKAGIVAGDKVLAIDGKSTAELSVEEAVQKIRGVKGTKVKLTILHEGADATKDFSMVRDTIEVPTIKTSVYDEAGKPINKDTGIRPGGIFVIRFMTFTANSPQLFLNALHAFVTHGGDKLVIDLRGNPGGYLDAAVDVASQFLPEGEVVVTERFGKAGTENVHRSRGYNTINPKTKIIVLIDKGSASASEILAGALQDQGKAKLVGERSFGKGSVQELVQLTPETSLKVTVARWYTPKGTSISDNGLTPDYPVELKKEDIDKGRDPALQKAIQLLTK